MRLIAPALFFAVSLPAFAAGDLPALKPVRTAAFDASSVYFNTDARTGIRYGYAYQFLTDISDLAGWDYDYRQCGWSDAYDMVRNGRIDVLAEVTYTPKRGEQLFFSDMPMGTETYCLFTAAEHPVSGIHDLNGKKIAVIRDSVVEDYLRDYLQENAVSAEIVHISSDREIPALMNRGKVAAFAGTGVQSEDGWQRIAELARTEYYFAVSKDRPDLKRELDAAMKTLIADNPYYIPELSKKYRTEITRMQKISQDELTWIRENPVLRLGYLTERLPYCTEGLNGRPAGVLGDAAAMIEKQFGLRVTGVPYTDTQAMADDLSSGKITAAFGLTDDQWIADTHQFSLCEPLFSDSRVIVTKPDFDPASRGSFAISAENRFDLPCFERRFPNAAFTIYPDNTAGLEAVLSGKADGFVGSANRLYHTINGDSRYLQLKITGTVHNGDFSFIVPKTRPQLYRILNRLNTFYSKAEISNLITRNITSEHRYSFRDFITYNATAVIAGLIVLFGSVLSGILFYLARTNKLYRLSYVDTLTGLKNRNAYEQMLEDLRRNPGRTAGIIFADINGLKEVNDLQGHTAGDERIREAAKCLLACFGHDCVCRVSGDEFVIIDTVRTEEAFNRQFEALLRLSAQKYGEILAAGKARAHTGTHIQRVIDEAESAMYAMKKEHYARVPDKSRRGTHAV